MGIKNFINNQNLLVPYKLQKTKLIIDGTNIQRHFADNNKIPELYIGEYNKISKNIFNFFSTLLYCRVDPYVVFDGIMDENCFDKTLKFRKNNSHLKAEYLIKTKRVYPILIKNILVTILEQLNIKFIFCNYNSDKHIASLALHFNCPLLSNNSTFFFYKLPAGVLFFESTTLEKKFCENFTYVPMKLYYIQTLINRFGLCFQDIYLFSIFNGKGKLSVSDISTIKKKLNFKSNDFIKFFNWLSKNPSTNETLNIKVKLLLGNNKEKIKLIESSLEDFKIKKSYFIEYFENFELKKNNYLIEKIINLKNQELPSCLQILFNEGKISPNLARVFYSPNILLDFVYYENESSHDCSKHIRTLFYSILGQDHETFTETEVLENEIKKTEIKKIIKFSNQLPIPNINVILYSSKQKRLDIYLDVFDREDDWFLSYEEKDKLLLSALIQWKRHSTPEINPLHVISSILVFFFPNNLPKIHGSTQEDIFSGTWKNIFHNQIKRICYDSSVIVSFAKLETFLDALSNLNSILNRPLQPASFNHFNVSSLLFVNYKLKTTNKKLYDYLSTDCFENKKESFDYFKRFLEKIEPEFNYKNF